MSWWPLPSCSCPSITGSTSVPWDAGIDHRTIHSGAPDEEAAIVAAVREKVLRVVNGDVEDWNLERLIKVATTRIQEDYNVALKPQTLVMTLSGFPAGKIKLKYNPVIEIVSFGYVDADGVSQQLAVSPQDFQLRPSAGYAMAELYPSAGASWPSSILAGSQSAVTITYRAGYEDEDDFEFLGYQHGLMLMVGESYKQRELSVVGTSIVPAPLDVSGFCRRWY